MLSHWDSCSALPTNLPIPVIASEDSDTNWDCHVRLLLSITLTDQARSSLAIQGWNPS